MKKMHIREVAYGPFVAYVWVVFGDYEGDPENVRQPLDPYAENTEVFIPGGMKVTEYLSVHTIEGIEKVAVEIAKEEIA